MKAVRSLVAGIILGAGALIGSVKADIPKPYFETSLVSDFVSPVGAAIKEECRQDLVSLNFGKFNFAIWENQFLGEKGISERDYCVTYASKINDKFSGSVGAQIWDYPNGRFGDFDAVQTAGLNYGGMLNANLGYAHLVGHDAVKLGDRVTFGINKSVPVYDGKVKISLTPSLDSAWANNWYGQYGFSQISAGIKLGVSKGNLSLDVSGKMQKSLDSKIEDLNWGSVGVGYKF
ncbi:Uncharacterised protein [uncultured archaeon]|nr:Uncharacterised protein [uncultured archaeon]